MSATGDALAAVNAERNKTAPKKADNTNSDGVIIERKTKSRIADAAAEFKSSGEVTVGESDSGAGNDDGNSDNSGNGEQAGVTPPAAPPAEGGETKPPEKKAPSDQAHNFKTLRTALDHANAKVEEYKTQLDKVKDYDTWKTKAEQLEAQMTEIEPKYKELNEWKTRYGLVGQDEYINEFTKPREQIAATVRAELQADGLDPALWEDIQNVKTRRELETIVNEHIDSELLKTQVYGLYFKDLEIRQREQAALAAPKQYLDRVRAEELERKAAQGRELESTYNTVWTAALSDADEMAMKNGPNRIVEITRLNGNNKHNDEVVKPILEVADNAARAEIEERKINGLPITRQIAANIVYKWRQAVAAQAVNQDRLHWYNQHQTLLDQHKQLQADYDALMANASPTPGSTNSNGSSGNVTGDTFQSRIGSLVDQVKSGK
jgi:hypothetical protein